MLAVRYLLHTIACIFLLIVPVFSQTFASPKNYPPFTDSYRLVVGDVNRDGVADLIGVTNLNGGTQIDLYLNNGTGAFGTPSAIPGTSGALQVQSETSIRMAISILHSSPTTGLEFARAMERVASLLQSSTT